MDLKLRAILNLYRMALGEASPGLNRSHTTVFFVVSTRSFLTSPEIKSTNRIQFFSVKALYPNNENTPMPRSFWGDQLLSPEWHIFSGTPSPQPKLKQGPSRKRSKKIIKARGWEECCECCLLVIVWLSHSRTQSRCGCLYKITQDQAIQNPRIGKVPPRSQPY